MALSNRIDLGEHSRNAAADRAERRTPVYLAQGIRNWLDSPTFGADAVTAAMGGRTVHAAEIMRVFPAAREVLGEAVVTASAGSSVPAPGCCRWAAAQLYAHVHDLPKPVFAVDLMPLLGRPCNLCTKKWMSSARDKFATVRIAQTLAASLGAAARVRHTRGVSSSVNSLAVRPDRMRSLHSSQSCAVCEIATDCGLTASAVPAHASKTMVVTQPMRQALAVAWDAKQEVGLPRFDGQGR